MTETNSSGIEPDEADSLALPPRSLRGRWPGIVATGFLVIATSFWTFWGVAEMFYEAWGLPFPQPLAYLIPGGIMLTLSLIALRFPAAGGLVVLAFGTWFTWWWWTMMYRRGANMLMATVTTFPMSAALIIVGILFLFEARRRRRARAAGTRRHPRWLVRNLSYVVMVGCPLVIGLGVAATQMYVVLNRLDDGVRTARVIEGNGVRLVWAPAGPGWNWKQAGGWFPAWDHLATYGQGTPGVKTLRPVNGKFAHSAPADMSRTGLCGYLTADGRTLASTPQYVWRMPTVDEIVRSLSRGGTNAGCAWSGANGFQKCREKPDKETPLWAPDQSAIYYWAADQFDVNRAWFVSYNGAVQRQPKNFGNPRHGYRCVREAGKDAQ